MNKLKTCSVCGNSEFGRTDVLWKELIETWEINAYEIDYINKQQGMYCLGCHNNLRSITLANAILKSFEFNGTLQEFVKSPENQSLKVLEINRAGGLTPILEQLKNHSLVEYPEVDMENMPYSPESYDLVIHSDTLEHISDPLVGLKECCRILKADGRCLFTVPILVDKVSRSRMGLPNSYHGTSDTDAHDLIVHTEFGMDAWQYVIKSGFNQVTFHSLEYPAGLAIEARI